MLIEKSVKFEKNYSKWRIELISSGGSGKLLHISKNEKTQVSLHYVQGWVGATVLFNHKDTPLHLSGKTGENSSVCLSCSGHYLALYVDNQLVDEEWPIGLVEFEKAECQEARGRIDFYEEPLAHSFKEEANLSVVQKWKPSGYNAYVGDCMPFMDNERLRIFYLFDRRKHGSKWGLGAHQWAQISTEDLKNWQNHPLAIGIDDQKEGSICTGSVIRNKDKYHAFYAVRTIDGSPAWLTCSVSKDGVHFSKTGKVFTLTERYHAPSARDPCVFKDSRDMFHMLVTTSLGSEEGNGCLAHLESSDLETWEEKEPFLALDIKDQPECSDYFFFNGFYYVIYSTSGLGRYLISAKPFGPWEKPDNNIVIGNYAVVPKSCIWRGERLFFVSWSPEYLSFGGGMLFHEAKQKPDGTLNFFPIPEIA